MKLFRTILECFLFLMSANIPGPLGIRLRRLFYGFLLGGMGRNVTFGIGVHITNPSDVFIGDNVWIDDYTLLVAGRTLPGKRYVYHKAPLPGAAGEGSVVIGNGVHIAPFSFIQGHGGVRIGDNCTIGSATKMYSLSHHYRTMGETPVAGLVCKYSSMAPQEEQSMILGNIVIEDNTAVLPNCILLAGAHLSEGSWLMAGSQLHDSIPPFKMAGGSPAKVLKDRSIG